MENMPTFYSLIQGFGIFWALAFALGSIKGHKFPNKDSIIVFICIFVFSCVVYFQENLYMVNPKPISLIAISIVWYIIHFYAITISVLNVHYINKKEAEDIKELLKKLEDYENNVTGNYIDKY